MSKKAGLITRERAEAIALAGLSFLAEDAVRLGRFLALTGMGPADLRSSASTPATLSAVLDHLLGDESLLLVFSASKDIAPAALQPARALLGGPAQAEETS